MRMACAYACARCFCVCHCAHAAPCCGIPTFAAKGSHRRERSMSRSLACTTPAPSPPTEACWSPAPQKPVSSTAAVGACAVRRCERRGNLLEHFFEALLLLLELLVVRKLPERRHLPDLYLAPGSIFSPLTHAPRRGRLAAAGSARRPSGRASPRARGPQTARADAAAPDGR